MNSLFIERRKLFSSEEKYSKKFHINSNFFELIKKIDDFLYEKSLSSCLNDFTIIIYYKNHEKGNFIKNIRLKHFAKKAASFHNSTLVVENNTRFNNLELQEKIKNYYTGCGFKITSFEILNKPTNENTSEDFKTQHKTDQSKACIAFHIMINK